MGKKTNVAFAIAAAAGAAWASTKAISKPKSRTPKEALEYEQPIILAHRGGSDLLQNVRLLLLKMQQN